MVQVTPLPPTDIAVFGGNGDLALRKIMPALYYRLRDGQLAPEGRIIGIARQPLGAEAYRARVAEAIQAFVPAADYTEHDWKRLAAKLTFAQVDNADPASFGNLSGLLDPLLPRVFYLATPADAFGPICEQLRTQGLVTQETRVVLEKPIGFDLASFRAVNAAVLAQVDERQVYRIDHYLGKETVQNLMVLRFANNLFARVWHGDAIDHVQITVAESIGLESRAGYYDKSGAMRDMVQNHLLQLLCLVAMEPPSQIDPDAVRDEKVKVLRSLRPIHAAEAATYTVRGQYRAGTVGGGAVAGYQDELERPSETETFVAIKTFVDSWRWSGVPFYLRTGKRLHSRYSEIVIQFRPVPHQLFPNQSAELDGNKLIIRLQPDESIKLQMITKSPGPGGYRFKTVDLNLSLADAFDERFPEAYERLLMDVVRGNPTLFMRSDEVEAAWRWTDAILHAWDQTGQSPKPYPAGSTGPTDAHALLARDGRRWHEPDEG